MLKTLLFIAILMMGAHPCNAQHPIDIQRMTADGEYYAALNAFLELPKRRITTETTLAAAKAAWGLSLPVQAVSYFESALADQNLTNTDRARINLARGIIDFQEERFQVAAVYAEKVVSLLPTAAPLRGRAWELWADSLAKQNLYGPAEAKYQLAVKELEADALPAVSFRLGLCRNSLGKYDLARQAFEQVPLNHPLAAEAVLHLALIALELQRFDQAHFWLQTGRKRFPESFLDSWVDYEQIRIAIHNQDEKSLQELLEQAEERHPPSDYWLTLAQSAAVAYQWKDLVNKGVVKDVSEQGTSEHD